MISYFKIYFWNAAVGTQMKRIIMIYIIVAESNHVPDVARA
jgi:hypothetical protein